VVLNKLSIKLKDPSSFSLPYLIENLSIDWVLYDLGSRVSLMPYSIFKRIDLGELRLTTISLQLADYSAEYPLGILEDFSLRCHMLVDFVILDMIEDAHSKVILRRPFLATASCKIDVK